MSHLDRYRSEKSRPWLLGSFFGCLVLFTVSAIEAGAAPNAKIQGEHMTLTAESLKGLKTTSNDPAGDAFVDSAPRLKAVIDAFVADSSLASPMYLYLAASTALRLGRTADAAFLFYAAQLRRRFDYQRYNINPEPDGNNAATYFSFLNQTIGQSVNPAIMSKPKAFSQVIARLESWELIPAPTAYYPEFAEAKGFKLKPAAWPEAARALKAGFMSQFGKKMSVLLNTPEYFKASQFVQDYNFGKMDARNSKNRKRYEDARAQMEKIEKRLFP